MTDGKSCSAEDGRDSHEDHKPDGLEDVNVNMDSSVDPVLSILCLWQGNDNNVEGDVEANCESDSQAKSKIGCSNDLSVTLGLLLKSNDQDHNSDQRKECSNNESSLNCKILSVSPESKPKEVNSNGD